MGMNGLEFSICGTVYAGVGGDTNSDEFDSQPVLEIANLFLGRLSARFAGDFSMVRWLCCSTRPLLPDLPVHTAPAGGVCQR